MTTTTTLGAKIRAARLERKLTQEQLAGQYFTKSYISGLERGAKTPRPATLRILARRLSLPPSYFRDGVAEDCEAEAYLKIGLAQLRAQSFDDARESLEKALESAAQQDDEALQTRIEVMLAMLDEQRGHLSQALRRLDRAFRALGRSGDSSLLAAAHVCAGNAKLEQGDPASALWRFKVALTLAQDLPRDSSLLTHLYLGLGIAHEKLGQMEEAREAFHQALETASPFQDQYHAGAIHLGAAVTAARQGLFQRALQQADQALAISDAMLNRRRLAEIHQRLAGVDLSRGRWEEAQQHYRWSVVLHGAVENTRGMVQTLGCLAEAMLKRACPEGAQGVCALALQLLPAEGDGRERAHLLRIRGTLCRILGRREEAKNVLVESLTAFDQLRCPDEARIVRQELALLALEAEDFAEARHQISAMREAPPLQGVSTGF